MQSITEIHFREVVYRHFREEGRSFPWRETHDPYCIMVSEFMLQQTQTSRVVQKYLDWLAVFPTVKELAEAPISQVLTYWQGLGYNRRALNLQRSAQKILSDFGGIMPERIDQLQSLPGIGSYTAGAIAVFAYDRPIPLIETNIRRVYIHHFFQAEEVVDDKQLLPLIEDTMDFEHPRQWFYALMDYGSQLPKKVTNPNRRSKHYTTQSKFSGSLREARGAIIKVLLEIGKSTKKNLSFGLQLDSEKIEIALSQLVDEGFLDLNDELYSLK